MPGGSGAAVGCGDADDGLSRNAQWVVFPGKTRQNRRLCELRIDYLIEDG